MPRYLIKKLSLLLLAVTVAPTLYADNLAQVVRYTVTTHPQITKAISTRLASDYALHQSKSAYLPTLDLVYSIGRENTENPNNLITSNTLSPRQFGLTFTQNIFAGLATEHEVARNQNTINANAYMLQATANDVALLAAQAYLAVKQQQERIHIAKENLNLHIRIYKMIKERYNSGLSRKADMTQTESRLALARSNYVAILSDLRAAKANYTAIVGQAPKQLQPIKTHFNQSKYFPVNESRALKLAITRQPLLKAATANIFARLEELKVSKAAFSPKIDAIINVNRNRDINGSNGLNENTAALVQVTWNLLNGGADFAKIKQNQALINEAKSIRANSIRETIQQTKLSWSTYVSAKEQMTFLTNHKVLAKQTVGFYIDQYRIGKRSLLDLLDAENEAFTSAIAYLNGYYNLLNGEIRVLHANNQLLTITHTPLPAEAIPVKPIGVITDNATHSHIQFHTQFANYRPKRNLASKRHHHTRSRRLQPSKPSHSPRSVKSHKTNTLLPSP